VLSSFGYGAFFLGLAVVFAVLAFAGSDFADLAFAGFEFADLVFAVGILADEVSAVETVGSVTFARFASGVGSLPRRRLERVDIVDSKGFQGGRKRWICLSQTG